MATTADLRNYLADHLHLIESGLQLRAKEFRLENSLGEAGRIDILATAQLRSIVVSVECLLFPGPGDERQCDSRSGTRDRTVTVISTPCVGCDGRGTERWS